MPIFIQGDSLLLLDQKAFCCIVLQPVTSSSYLSKGEGGGGDLLTNGF